MCLDLKYKYLPWDYEGYEKMPRQEIDYSLFYPNESLCEIIKLCFGEFQYGKLFTILDNNIKINI
jgi:hypothetical protein